MSDLIGALRVTLGLDATDFERRAGAARGVLVALKDEVVSIQQKVAGFGLAMTTAASVVSNVVGGMAFKARADFIELESAFEQTFGDMSDSLKRWSEAQGDVLGRSTQEIMAGVNTFGIYFNQAARTRQEAAQMSQQFALLGQDLASFFNTSPDDALLALRSGLSGESEPMRRYGVFLSDMALRNEMARQGIQGTTQDLTEQQKVMLRAAIILRDTTSAQGDVLRTSDSAANSMRSFRAAIDEALVEIGTIIEPVITVVIKALRDIVTAFNNLPDGVKRGIVYFGMAVAALGPLAIAMALLIGPAFIARWVAGFGIIGRVLAFIISPITELIAMFGGLVARMGAMALLRVAFTALTGPIGIAVQLILLFKDYIIAAFRDVWAYAQQTLGPPLQELFTKLGDAWSSVSGVLGPVIDWLVGAFEACRQVMGSVIQEILTFLGGQIVDGIASFIAAIGNVVDFVAGFVRMIAAILRGDWGAAWDEAGGMIDNFVQFVINIIGGIFPPIRDTLMSVYGMLKYVFIDMIGSVVAMVAWGAQQIWTWFTNLVAPVTSAISAIGGAMWTWLVDKFGQVIAWVRARMTELKALWNGLRAYMGFSPASGAAAAQASGVAAATPPQAGPPSQGSFRPPAAAAPSGGADRRRSSGGRQRQGMSPEERAERMEELRLRNDLDVAREAEDLDAQRRIERQMDLNRLIKQYGDLGINSAQARVMAESQLALLEAARATIQQRDLAANENALRLEEARLDKNYQMVDELERAEDIRERTERLHRMGLSLEQAQTMALEQNARLVERQELARRRMLEDQAREHQLELARRRGDTEEVRQLERASDVERRAREIATDRRISLDEARTLAEQQQVELDEASLRGTFRETFRDGVMAALDGDFGDWFKDWWRERMAKAMEDALNDISDLLLDLFRSAMGQASDGASKGGGGGILGAIGSVIGMAFGNGLSPKTASGQVTSTGSKDPIDLFGFSTGGSFKVGGSGGVDSTLVRFRATPGEVVDVKRGDLARQREGVVVYVRKGEMFDAHVERVAAPMVEQAGQRAAVAGAHIGQRQTLRRQRSQLA